MPPSQKPASAFVFINKLQGEVPFGTVLDAGTGPASMNWLLSIDTDSWAAVTAAKGNALQVRQLIGKRQRQGDRLIVDNWANPKLLEGERFDTVLAHHLIGALDGFAPFLQTTILRRLRELTGKRLYLVGMEPYTMKRPSNEAGQLMFDIGRYRDSALLLAGQLPFREYPMKWTIAELEHLGFKIIGTKRFPMNLPAVFVESQINRTLKLAGALPDRQLGDALEDRGFALRDRALDHIKRHGGIASGFNYLVAAEPV